MKTTYLKRPDLPPITVISHKSVSAKIYTAQREKSGQTYSEHTLVYSEAGKRVRRAFADLSEAKREAEIALDRIASGQTKALSLTNADAEAYILAKRELSGIGQHGVPLLEAVREYRAAMLLLKGSATLNEAVRFFLSNGSADLPKKTPAEVQSEMIKAKTADGLSAVHLRDLGFRLDRFAEKFTGPIAEITTAQIEDWLRDLGTGPRNRNNFAAVITNLFRFARKRGYLTRDRATAADSLQRAKAKGAPIEIFTPDEVAAMLSRLRRYRPEFVPFVAIGAFAGLRTAELMRLEWSDVKFDEGHIVVGADKAKTATRRLVPISPNLATWLAPFKENKGKLSEFVRLPHLVQREVSATITKDGVTEAGIAWKHNGLRHSFISYRVAATQDVAKVALEAGNSPRMIFQHYRELVSKNAAESFWKI